MGSYWSKTYNLDEEVHQLQMYCPRCNRMVNQNKSFGMKDGHYTDEAVVRCSKCGLIYGCKNYENLVKERKEKSLSRAARCILHTMQLTNSANLRCRAQCEKCKTINTVKVNVGGY
jgi:hypothetical protein